MKPTRMTQPYRAGARMPGAALLAMAKGTTAGGANPKDAERAAFMVDAAKKASGRKHRVHRKPRS